VVLEPPLLENTWRNIDKDVRAMLLFTLASGFKFIILLLSYFISQTILDVLNNT
jgi:hypothetical protein